MTCWGRDLLPHERNLPKRPLVVCAANAGFEPTAEVFEVCCARSLRENRCACSVSDAAWRQRYLPFSHVAARILVARIKSRTKRQFAALRKRPQLTFHLCCDLPCYGPFQRLLGKPAVLAFQLQLGEGASMFLSNAFCQKVKNHANA